MKQWQRYIPAKPAWPFGNFALHSSYISIGYVYKHVHQHYNEWYINIILYIIYSINNIVHTLLYVKYKAYHDWLFKWLIEYWYSGLGRVTFSTDLTQGTLSGMLPWTQGACIYMHVYAMWCLWGKEKRKNAMIYNQTTYIYYNNVIL